MAASASAKCLSSRALSPLGAGRPTALAHASVAASFGTRDEPGCSLKSVHLGSALQRVQTRFSGAGSGKLVSRGVRSQAAVVNASEATKLQTGTWLWKYGDQTLKIYFEEHLRSSGKSGPVQDVLFLPSIADVSYTGEWSAVARDLIGQDGTSWRAIVVDWPGLGYSDRPPLDYSYEVMERFLKEFMTATDGPLASSPAEEGPVIIGAGHGASVAVKAVSKGLIKARAIAAVAPTWAGPLPIVFGRDDTMEGRYGLLRGTLRAPGLGWAAYKYLVSSPSNVRTQYLTHVYAEADNVSTAVVEKGIELTQIEGARFVSAAFLTGQLDPTRSREEFISLFAGLDGKVPTLVVSTTKSPRRSRAEMEALNGIKGVSKYTVVSGALLPQEEYPEEVAGELKKFLSELPE